MRFIYLFLILFEGCCIGQNKKAYYQDSKILFDTNFFYVYGRKEINESNKNLAEDGFEHNSNFYVSKFNSEGKKLWESIIDKKRTFIISSELVKRGSFLYTLIVTRNRKHISGISYINHFLIKLDSLGNVVQEKKLQDSSSYLYSNIFFAKEFIYVTRNKEKDKPICEKYDYNFKLIGINTDPLLTSFLYDSKVIQTYKNFISVGPINDLIESETPKNNNNQLLKQVRNCIKKTDLNFSKEQKTTIAPLPVDEIIDEVLYENNKVYIKTRNLEWKRKLFVYDIDKNKLELITDTITCGLDYLKVFSDNEYLYISQASIVSDGRTNKRVEHPEILYYIKNNRVITRFELKDVYNKLLGKNEFKIVDKKLFIYQVNNFGEDIKIKVFNYENGTFDL